MKKKLINLTILIFLAILFNGRFIYASNFNRDVALTISMDKNSFYSNEKIVLTVSVRNISTRSINFSLFDNKNFAIDYGIFQPKLFDLNGKEIENIVPYVQEGRFFLDEIKKLKSSKKTVFLKPGDIYIHNINLKKLYLIKSGIGYRVNLFFLYNLNKKTLVKSDNIVKFYVKNEFTKIIANKTKPIYDITPDEVVSFMLNAEKNRNWSKMTKYIDLRKMINSYPKFVNLFNSTADYNKFMILSKFKKFLSRMRFDYLLDYKIVRTKIDKKNGMARIDLFVKRYAIKRPDFYRYRYFLERKNNFWLITGLEASVTRGTEE